ncbi:MAG TPA: cupin domain-containing protein [Candidatus Limnocylindria bacterium]|nr:cupin domain-containing protein [Candidatus Limnocylindria bacterium]
MRIERPSPDKRRPNADDIFVGVVESQRIVGDEARDLRLNEHTFRDGARNKLHTHTTDQLLIVTAGEGIVATEHEEQTVRAGDVAYIPAGERHWHGAKPGMDMTHLAILGSGKTFIVADDRPAD